MKFTKMHGCGNDYVYVNCFEETVEDPEKTAIYVSRPHFAVGSDGLILIKPSAVADCRMHMFNMDGSEGKMCGNGIRCVAKYAYEHGIAKKDVIRIETGDGVKEVYLSVRDGHVDSVRVNMGEPVLTSALPEDIVVGGKKLQFTGISTGNPHAVYICDEIADMDLGSVGPAFENHERFKDRVNSEFVKVVDRRHICMRVWERGSGETLACGTGATASAAACILLGLTENSVQVSLLGGDITIDWEGIGHPAYMTGPAEEVFTGYIELPAQW